LLEIRGPVGIKMAENPKRRFQGIIIAIVFMVASGTCLWLAQRQIPMGTAYVVWTASARWER
jgi:quaternary ammonium compound-resistance protein SugE